MAMETVAKETQPVEPVVETMEGIAPRLGTAVAPWLKMEMRVNPLLGASTDVVVREPIIEEVKPIRSAPMPEASSRRGGLELLDNDFIDPAVVARRMDSWRSIEQWIKVHCGYPE
jgi:hypothetical protein